MATHAESAAAVLTDVWRHIIDAEPVAASSLGEETGSGRLPDLSQHGLAQRHAAEDALTLRLDGCSPPEGPEDECDLACARAYLAGRAALRPWQPWARDPRRYLTPPLVALNLARRAGGEPAARAALGVLRDLPELLAAGRRNLDPALVFAPVARRAAAQARAGVAMLRDLPRAVAPDTLAMGAAAGNAAERMTEFEGFLGDLAETATGDFRLGAGPFAALIQGRDGIAGPLGELVTSAEQELAACRAEMADRLGSQWRDKLAELSSLAPATQDEMLHRYTGHTARARLFCAESGLFTMVDEQCEVAPAPPFRRALLAVASYEPPPILKTANGGVVKGVFNVPFVPDGADESAIHRRLRSNSGYQLATRTVHETYPGHHWHFSRMRLAGRHGIRLLARSTAFMEGWATYAEQAMDRAGFFQGDERFGYLEARAFRAVRLVVDIGLHTGELSASDALATLVWQGLQTTEVAERELVRYQASPTDASAYLMGALALDRYRSEFVSRGGTDRGFHDLVTAFGVPPLTGIETQLRMDTAP